MPMLEIRNVRVVYEGGNEALKNVSLNAERGEIISIIGRSGAGKSTLLRTINGLQTVTSGEIILDGENITNMRGAALRRARSYVGFIWQEHHLIERLSAMTNVLTGRLAYANEVLSWLNYFNTEHRKIALFNLERIGLLHRANFRADRLSGGEKQRVSIARAISQEPKILLADEPVASLDPELAVQVMDDLARVAREDGVLTLINLHQVELAKRFSDRIVGIAQGKVEFDGSPDELTPAILDRIYRFDKPKHDEPEPVPSVNLEAYPA